MEEVADFSAAENKEVGGVDYPSKQTLVEGSGGLLTSIDT
jgi:hypothetical protein